jgi:hypothetical protein
MSEVITEKTTREIAQEIVLTGGTHVHGSIICFERNALAYAIDKALRDRDECAARIAESFAPEIDCITDPMEHSYAYGKKMAALAIAAAVRGSK